MTKVQQVLDECFTGQAAVGTMDPSVFPTGLGNGDYAVGNRGQTNLSGCLRQRSSVTVFGLLFVTFRSVQRRLGAHSGSGPTRGVAFSEAFKPGTHRLSGGWTVRRIDDNTGPDGHRPGPCPRLGEFQPLPRNKQVSCADIAGIRGEISCRWDRSGAEPGRGIYRSPDRRPHQAMLWSGKFTRPLSQLPEMRTEMANSIAKEIQIKIAPESTQRGYLAETSDPQAHQAFLHGRYELEQQNVAAFQRALEQFTNAATLDPHYARAYAGIAESYIDLATVTPPGPAYAYAKAAALNAIHLDNGLSQAHRDLARVLFYYDHDLQGAEREYRRALQLNPSDARTHHWYAQLLLAERRTDEALREVSTGLALDPLSLASNSNYAFILIQAGQPAQAVLHLQELQKRDPKNELTYEYLGKAYDGLHEYERAAESFKRARELSESKYGYEANLAYALAKGGDVATAQVLADRLEIKANSGEWIPASAMTEAYIGLGKKDRAFFWFNRCVAEHSCSLLEANAEPIYSGLSGDRRFEKIAGPLYGHQNELAQIDVRK